MAPRKPTSRPVAKKTKAKEVEEVKQPLTNEDKVDRARELIARHRIPEAAKALREEYKCSRDCAYDLIRQARAYNRGLVDRDKDDLKGELASILEEVITNKIAKDSDRLKAVRMLQRMFGLEAPVRIVSVPPMFDPEDEQESLSRYNLNGARGVSSIDAGEEVHQELAVPEASSTLGDRCPQAPYESNGQSPGG